MLQEIYGGGNQSKLKEGISDEQEIRNEIEAPTIKYKTPAKESLRDGNTDTQEIRNHIEEHNEKSNIKDINLSLIVINLKSERNI